MNGIICLETEWEHTICKEPSIIKNGTLIGFLEVILSL